MDELESAGAFDDNLSLTAGQDDIDRQLSELTSQSDVDADLARMKAELGQGSAPQGTLGPGEAEQGAPEGEPSQERPA
jgi:phage shock protein A